MNKVSIFLVIALVITNFFAFYTTDKVQKQQKKTLEDMHKLLDLSSYLLISNKELQKQNMQLRSFLSS